MPFFAVGNPGLAGALTPQQQQPQQPMPAAGYVDPATIQRRQQLADALRAAGQSNRPRTGVEALGNLAQTLSAAFIDRKANKASEANSKLRQDSLAAALSASDPLMALAQSQDPSLRQFALEQQVSRGREDQLYKRSREDKRADIADERQYGEGRYAVTRSDKIEDREDQQSFAAAQNAESRAFSAGENEKNRETQLEIAGARTQALLDAEAAKRNKVEESRKAALNTWNTAKQGLVDALEETNTGPIVGRLPAVTAKQQTAEGAAAALAPVLKQIFRTAGEGTFTDRDQALLLEMAPTRKDRPEARAAKIKNIDAIIAAKLGGQSGLTDAEEARLQELERKIGGGL